MTTNNIGPTPTRRTWVITGPTSGIGRRAALELSTAGTLVLVGRDPAKLADVQREIEGRGGHALTLVCDFSDVASARRAANEIAALDLPLSGVLNNAGIMSTNDAKTADGRDLSWATNHLGPFAFTETLMPHLPDGANVVFVVSAVEDPTRRAAVAAGFRGGRYLSAEASARGEWVPGGASRPGLDAYATSKQANLATVLAFARETPRLRFRAIEPGFNPGTGLGRDANTLVKVVSKYLVAPLAPLLPGGSTPKRAGRLLARVLTDDSAATGTYYNEDGQLMQGSAQVRDPAFSDRVVAETRAFLRASNSASGR